MTKALYFVRFSDDGIYSAGQQGAIPGGPLGYALRADAEVMAGAIGGTVFQRTLEEAIEKSLEYGHVLWIKLAGKRHVYIEETVPAEASGKLIRLAGEERLAAISASWRLS